MLKKKRSQFSPSKCVSSHPNEKHKDETHVLLAHFTVTIVSVRVPKLVEGAGTPEPLLGSLWSIETVKRGSGVSQPLSPGDVPVTPGTSAAPEVRKSSDETANRRMDV